MFEQQKVTKSKPSREPKLAELSATTDVLVYGASSKAIKDRDFELDNLISNTLKTTIKNQFGSTNKPLEYFSLNMLNDLWSKTGTNKRSDKKKDFEDVLKQYVSDNQGDAISTATKIKYDNYRSIYSHLPAAHVGLNIYKSSILSPESLTDEPINFAYKTNDTKIKNIMEQRIKYRIIDKYKLNQLMTEVVKEALIDGVSYRAVISIEKDLENILKTNRVLNEDSKMMFDENYSNGDIKIYDSEITKAQTEYFNAALQEAARGYVTMAEKYIGTEGIKEEDKNRARLLIENVQSMVRQPSTKKSEGEEIRLTSAQIGRHVRDLVNSNIVVKSKLDFMEDYTDALMEGFTIDADENIANLEEDVVVKPNLLSESYSSDKRKLYLNGSKIIALEPEKVTPIRIGGIVIGYIYTERDMAMDPMTVNGGVAGAANISQGAPVSYGVNSFGSSGLNGLNNSQGMNSPVTNPLSIFSAQQTTNDYIVNMFVGGLGKKLNKTFIRNNKEIKELIHELLRDKYITQKKVAVTFFSSDDVIETRVKPLFEGSEFFAKLYLAELTNNITISLGRGMDRRMIKIPFGLDDDMSQTVQDAIRTFKTREFSIASIDDSTITSLVRLSPGRFEDMYIPVGPDGTMGYDVDILPGQDNSKSSELLPMLKNQFLDSINIPASALDSAAEVDFSRSIALRNVHFTKEIVDYQKTFNESSTQLIRKLYTDEYRYVGNKENNEPHINLDSFKAWFAKPYNLEVATTLETMQNVDQYATYAANIVADTSDPSSIKAIHKLKQKIFKDTMAYLPWDEWEKFYNDAKTGSTVEVIKSQGKKKSPIDVNDPDPNNFNPY